MPPSAPPFKPILPSIPPLHSFKTLPPSIPQSQQHIYPINIQTTTPITPIIQQSNYIFILMLALPLIAFIIFIYKYKTHRNNVFVPNELEIELIDTTRTGPSNFTPLI
jgi:hypothetical protein